MRPVSFESQTEVYRALDGKGAPYPDSAMPVRIESDGIVSQWAPTTRERERIAAGANIELKTFGSKTPPLSMLVLGVPDDESRKEAQS